MTQPSGVEARRAGCDAPFLAHVFRQHTQSAPVRDLDRGGLCSGKANGDRNILDAPATESGFPERLVSAGGARWVLPSAGEGILSGSRLGRGDSFGWTGGGNQGAGVDRRCGFRDESQRRRDGGGESRSAAGDGGGRVSARSAGPDGACGESGENVQGPQRTLADRFGWNDVDSVPSEKIRHQV